MMRGAGMEEEQGQSRRASRCEQHLQEYDEWYTSEQGGHDKRCGLG